MRRIFWKDGRETNEKDEILCGSRHVSHHYDIQEKIKNKRETNTCEACGTMG
jgi:hypothetical protein